MFLRLVFILSLLVLQGFSQNFQSVLENEATLTGQGKNHDYCANCGMRLVKFYKTNHTYKSKQYSSLACLYEATKGQIPLDGAMVVDTKNLNFIDVNKAFYVVGSKVKGTMSKISKYAFSNINDAKEFQAKNGGEILNFAQAYEVAGKDFINAPKDEKIKEAKPQKIVAPKDARCAICGMLVNKNPQWIAMIDDDKFFDGVKDMMRYYLKHNKNFKNLYVNDYYKLHKIDAKSAFYVLGSDVLGPMGDELIAFENEKSARTFAKDHAGVRVLKFDEIDESVLKGL